MSRLSPGALRAFSAAVLTASGVPDDDAALVADSLVQADLWGHQSHGVLRLPWYVARLRSGAMNARTDPAVLSDTGPLVLLDGRDGIGQVLTEHARRTAPWSPTASSRPTCGATSPTVSCGCPGTSPGCAPASCAPSPTRPSCPTPGRSCCSTAATASARY